VELTALVRPLDVNRGEWAVQDGKEDRMGRKWEGKGAWEDLWRPATCG